MTLMAKTIRKMRSSDPAGVAFTDASSKREGIVTPDRKYLERKVWT